MSTSNSDMMGSKPNRQAPLSLTPPVEPAKLYPLYASCRDRSEPKYNYRLVIVGDTGTGKTFCSWRLSGSAFHPLQTYCGPTVNVRTCLVTLDDVQMKVQIWDTCGLERIASIRSSCYSKQGIIALYDTTSLESFDHMQYWMSEINKYSHPEAVVMLVGNKCDLSEEKEVDYATARNFADEHNLTFFEVSAKDGTNTELVLMSLVAQIRQRHCEQDVY